MPLNIHLCNCTWKTSYSEAWMDVHLFFHCSCHFSCNPAITAGLMLLSGSTSLSGSTICFPATKLQSLEIAIQSFSPLSAQLLSKTHFYRKSSRIGCWSSRNQLCNTVATEFWSNFPLLSISALSLWCSSVGSTETL